MVTARSRLETICPGCQVVNTHVTQAEGEKVLPVDGDTTICIDCGTWAIYVVTPETTTLRLPTESEQAELDADPVVQEMTAWWRDNRAGLVEWLRA